MTAVTEEILIEGIDLGGAPPCEIIQPGTAVTCGKPAAFRLVYTCSCGRLINFACAPCRVKLTEIGAVHFQGNHAAFPAGEC